MAPTNNVTRLLDAKNIHYGAHELPNEKLGGIEAAAHLGVPAEQVFKTIVSIPDSGKPVLALLPAPATLDLKLLARALKVGKVKVSSQAQAEELTGLQTGGISPLALVGKGFRVLLDDSAKSHAIIYISGGQRGLNVSLAPDDLAALTGARFTRLSAG
jgi:Cys-tRNA(Pro)/Cys-tRNA(Cys) deacylase